MDYNNSMVKKIIKNYFDANQFTEDTLSVKKIMEDLKSLINYEPGVAIDWVKSPVLDGNNEPVLNENKQPLIEDKIFEIKIVFGEDPKNLDVLIWTPTTN